MDDEWSYDGSALQMAGAATWKLRRPSCVYVNATSMSWHSCQTKICPTRNAGDWDADIVEEGRTVLTDTVIRRDCYFELFSLWHWEPTKQRREGPAWCVRICQHRRPDGWQHLGRSEVDGWLVKRRRPEGCCSNQLDWRWMQQLRFAEHLLVVIAGCCVTAGADKSSCRRFEQV